MSSLLRQAADMESYARAAAKWATEYEAEGDHVRASRYHEDARWYGERAAMYRQMWAEREQEEAA